MMSTSGINYDKLDIPYFKELLDTFDQVMETLNIPFYLVGVNAMALTFLNKGENTPRKTGDVDFAIAITNYQQYQKVVENLAKQGFQKIKNTPFTFKSNQYNLIADVIPFGEISNEDLIKIYNNQDFNVLGFKEVLAESNEIPVENKFVKVPPLPGLIILKLIAWYDRPEERDNDLDDILKIIDHYNKHHFDEIIEEEQIITAYDEFDPLLASARFLGMQTKPFLKKSNKLKGRIFKIFHEELANIHTSQISGKWARIKDWKVNYAYSLLNELKTGMES